MDETSDLPKSAFWDFSLAVYGKPGFPQAAISLQDRHGLNVNMLLFCLWAGANGRLLEGEDLQRLEGALDPWNEAVVEPLRAVRRWLKDQDLAPRDQAESLARAVLAREIEGEAIAQRLMERTAPVEQGGTASPEAAAENLKRYLESRSVDADPADLETLLKSACAEPDRDP